MAELEVGTYCVHAQLDGVVGMDGQSNDRPIYRPDPPLSRESKIQRIHGTPQREIGDFGPVPTETALNIAGSPRGSITTSNPFGESLKTVTKQLLQAPGATDMVITDIRTPPKIKTQVKPTDEFVPLGKGEAIPIPLDEHDAYELIHSTSQEVVATKNPTMTPASTGNGISTWILLSNSDGTTPTASATQLKSQKPTVPTIHQSTNPTTNNKNSTSVSKKKPVKPTENSNLPSTTTETVKTSFDIIAKPERKPTNNKQNTTKKIPPTHIPISSDYNQDEIRTPITINLQDSKFKNRQPVIMGRVPTTSTTVTKNKTENIDSNNNYNVNSKKKPSTQVPLLPTSEIKIETNTIAAMVPTRRRPHPQTTTTTTSAPTTVYYPTSTMPTPISTRRVPVYHSVVPTTSVIIESESAEPDDSDDLTTTEAVVQTTKRPRRPANKKKKKPGNNNNTNNKNRRRRPVQKDAEDSSVLESKITEELANATKTASQPTSVATSPQGSRPLSTRIYNYLAREVMPSVGVGVVGLLLTAGLAGLFLYPFGGGVAARRTSYETTKNALPSPDGHMYYYNEYASKSDVDNAQNEEAVFGQVLSGLSQTETQYESRPSTFNDKNNNNSNKNNNENSKTNNNNNSNKFLYDPALTHSSSNTASIVYPSTKDAQKYAQSGTSSSEQSSAHLNPNRMQDSATGYSTLTDISAEGSHNDRNYPSLTTDTITDSQYPNTQYSSVSSGSSGSTYSSGSSSKTGGNSMYSSNTATMSGSPQYASLIGTPMSSQSSNSGSSYSSLIGTSSANLQNSNSNSQYTNIINSNTGNTQSSNSNPSYSNIISSSQSVGIAGTNGSPQYQSLVSGSPSASSQSSSGIISPQYSPMVSSSSNTQYSGSILIDSPSSNHYSKTVIPSTNSGIHQYSTQLNNDHNSASQYSTLTGISVDNSDNSKYPSLTTQSHHQNKYQSSGEYAAYNNPSDVGTQSVLSYGSSGSTSGDNHRTSDQDSASSSSSLAASSSASSANTWKEMEYGVGVGVVEKDSSKEEDKSDKSQPQFAALHSAQYMSHPSRTDQSSFPSNIDMISITGGSNYSPTSSGSSSASSTGTGHRQSPLTSIEHGPRYFHLTHRRKRRQVEEPRPTASSSSSPSINEIDGELPKDDSSEIYKMSQGNLMVGNLVKASETTVQPTTIGETTTDFVTTMMTETTTNEVNETSTNINDTVNSDNSTHGNIEESLKDAEPTTQRPPSDDFTFLGFVRRLAHLKLKLGLNFLRSTSQAVSKYLQTVQQRMEKVVRRLEKRARTNERHRSPKDTTSNRRKRDIKYNERKQKHKKSAHHNKKMK